MEVLLRIDIARFKPAMFPVTTETQEQKERTLDSLKSWWLSCLRSGIILTPGPDDPPPLKDKESDFGSYLGKKEVYQAYARWVKEEGALHHKRIAVNTFWKDLASKDGLVSGAEEKRTGGDGHRVCTIRFPSHKVCVEIFQRKTRGLVV